MAEKRLDHLVKSTHLKNPQKRKPNLTSNDMIFLLREEKMLPFKCVAVFNKYLLSTLLE